MSGSVAFDTLKFVETLEAGGFDRRARAAAEAFAEATSQELATKTDLAALEKGLAGKIDSVRAELKSEIAEFRAELKSEIAEFRAELKSEIAEVRAGLKSEIAEVRNELRTESVAIRSELKSEISSVRSDIVAVRSEIELSKRDLKIWFGSIMVVAVGVILAAIRYLPPPHP
jgi:gas vesicle protein